MFYDLYIQFRITFFIENVPSMGFSIFMKYSPDGKSPMSIGAKLVSSLIDFRKDVFTSYMVTSKGALVWLICSRSFTGLG